MKPASSTAVRSERSRIRCHQGAWGLFFFGARRLHLPPCDRLDRHSKHRCRLALRQAEETPDTQDPESLLRWVMRTMPLGHPVPACPKDPSSLTRHPEEQGALFGPFEQSRRSRPRFPQLPERRAEGEAEDVRGAQQGGKSRWRTAASWRSGRVHEGPPPGQNARLRGGVKIPRTHRERDRMAPVSRATGTRQFPLRPYSGN